METNQKPWDHLETTLENHGNQPKTMKLPWKTMVPSACGWSGTPWLIVAPSLWACGPRRPPSPRRLGRPQVEAPHQDPWRKWAQPLTSMAKAELDQICWTTLLKDFCNNTSVFLQEHFSISATSFCFFATRSIYTEAQRHSFDPKNVTWQTRGPNRPLEWESAHFLWHPRGHNWPFRCLVLCLTRINGAQ